MSQNPINHVFDDMSELSKFCGNFIADIAAKAIIEKGIFTMGMFVNVVRVECTYIFLNYQ